MVTEIIVTILGSLAIIIGFIGCIVPGLPGPILSFIALIIISIPEGFSLFKPVILIILGVSAVGAQLLDNLFPILSSKKAGAGKAGIWGSVIGMIAGMFLFPPVGVIVGAFVGAFAGEIIFNPENKEPFKAALGILTGTMLGIVVKLVVCGVITGFFINGAKDLFILS